MRIAGVWMTALAAASLFVGGAEGFLIVFAMYGVILTLPALFALWFVRKLEQRLLDTGYILPALSLGIVIGSLVPVLLYLIAPNPENAKQALVILTPLSIGTGLLWTVTALPVALMAAERS